MWSQKKNCQLLIVNNLPEHGSNRALPDSLQFFLAALQVAYLRTQAADFTETAMEQFLEVCVRIAALQSPPAPVPPGTLQSLLLRGLDFVLQDMQGRLPCCEGLALMVPRLSPDDADAVLKKAQVSPFFSFFPPFSRLALPYSPPSLCHIVPALLSPFSLTPLIVSPPPHTLSCPPCRLRVAGQMAVVREGRVSSHREINYSQGASPSIIDANGCKHGGPSESGWRKWWV